MDHLNSSTGILQARIVSLVVEPMIVERMTIGSHQEEIDAVTLDGIRDDLVGLSRHQFGNRIMFPCPECLAGSRISSKSLAQRTSKPAISFVL
jgi:hypothetical protein